MMFNRSFFVAALMGGIVPVSPALAQDAMAPTPAQETSPASTTYVDTTAPSRPYQDTAKDFTGLYIMASGGYDIQKNDLGSRINFDRNGDGTFDQVNTAAGANAFSPGFCNGKARDATRVQNCENDRNKASYYARIGFDVQRGPFLIGALGEFGRTDIVDYVSAFSTTPANYVMSRSVDWESSGRLRVGYPTNGGLFYATGGVGYARINHSFTTSNTANAFSTIEDDSDKFGFIVGGGAEIKVYGPFTIGVEYTYHDYKDGQYKVLATRGTAPATNPFVLPPNTAGTVFQRSDDNFRWHSLRATVGFHF